MPVGTTDWLGGYKGAIGPWATGKLGTAAVPTMLKDTGTGRRWRRSPRSQPDLILALYSGLTKEQYETLSKFAPVVAQPKEYNDYGIPWQAQTETIGKALGKEAEARKLVEDVDGHVHGRAGRRTRSSRGQAPWWPPRTRAFFVYGSQDSRSRTLTSLGFTLPADLDKVIGDKFGASISKERTRPARPEGRSSGPSPTSPRIRPSCTRTSSTRT